MGFDVATMDQLRKVVYEAVREEFRIFNPAPVAFPLPHDIQAEGELIHLGIAGKLDVRSGSLLASEFFLPLHRMMWEALPALEDAKVSPSVPAFTAELEAKGEVVTETTKVEMEELFIPFTPSGSPTELRERVQEAYRARRMIEWFQRMEADLRVGNASSEDVKRKMLRWASKERDGKAA